MLGLFIQNTTACYPIRDTNLADCDTLHKLFPPLYCIVFYIHVAKQLINKYVIDDVADRLEHPTQACSTQDI